MEEVNKLYKELYEKKAVIDHNKWKKTKDTSFLKHFINTKMEINGFLMGDVENKRVLDIGCADGVLLNYIKDFKEYVGIDISEKRVKNANIFIKENNIPNAKVYLRNAEEPFDDLGVFDCIYCLELLEHVLDPINILDNIKGVSNKDTRILITTPDGEFNKPNPPEHLRIYTRGGLALLLKLNGFKPIHKKILGWNKSMISVVFIISNLRLKLKGDKYKWKQFGQVLSTIYVLVKVK